MARRHSISNDSLELLLDTICNTFGGVLFIAILVVLLLQQTTANTAAEATPLAPVSQVEIQSLANQLDNVTAELSRLSENKSSQEAVMAQFAPSEVRSLLAQRRDAESRQSALQSEVDQLRLSNAQKAARIESLRRDNKDVEATLAEAVNRNRQARETLESERQARIEEVRLPVIRSTFGKSEIGLILRYGRLYVWHRYGSHHERLGLNTDDFVVVADNGDSLVTRPNPTKGIPLDGSAASGEAIRRTLRQFDPKTCYLVMVVRPDSYGVFKHVRDQAIALKFDYRLMPLKEKSEVADQGGTGGKVQ